MRVTYYLSAKLALDVAFTFGCAVVLWNNGGTTVVNGSLLGIVSTALIAILLIALRCLVPHALAQHVDLHHVVRNEQILLLTQSFALAVLYACSHLFDSYFLAWAFCFGSISLLIASGWQLLRSLTIPPTSARDAGRRRSQPNELSNSLPVTRLCGILVAATAVACAAPVHEWQLPLFNTLIVVVSLSIFIGAGLAAWIVKVRSDSPHVNPGPGAEATATDRHEVSS